MNPRNLVVEFVGTFFLVFVIGLTVVSPGAGDMAPLAIGATLMVMVYAGGHISGGHYNPAVTLGVFLRGKCPGTDVIPYMLTQCLGAIIAGLLVNFIKGKGGPVMSGSSPDIVKALVIEFLFTFALVNSVLNTATSKKNEGNSYYGLAIGFTVVAGAYAGGSISGGAYNPAVACGLTTMGISPVANIWIFLVPNFLAAVAAAAVYKFANPEERPGAKPNLL